MLTLIKAILTRIADVAAADSCFCGNLLRIREYRRGGYECGKIYGWEEG